MIEAGDVLLQHRPQMLPGHLFNQGKRFSGQSRIAITRRFALPYQAKQLPMPIQ